MLTKRRLADTSTILQCSLSYHPLLRANRKDHSTAFRGKTLIPSMTIHLGRWQMFHALFYSQHALEIGARRVVRLRPITDNRIRPASLKRHVLQNGQYWSSFRRATRRKTTWYTSRKALAIYSIPRHRHQGHLRLHLQPKTYCNADRLFWVGRARSEEGPWSNISI